MGFVADYLKDTFPLNGFNDANEVVRHIFQMLTVEHTPSDLIDKVCSFEKKNEYVLEFYDSNILNSYFSVLMVKKFKCPKKHLAKLLFPSMGLILRYPREGENLSDLMSSYFKSKISTLECTECKRVNSDNGSEKIQIVKFPKYLVLYIDALDKNGLLKHPIKKTESAIDITAFADPDTLEEG